MKALALRQQLCASAPDTLPRTVCITLGVKATGAWLLANLKNRIWKDLQVYMFESLPFHPSALNRSRHNAVREEGAAKYGEAMMHFSSIVDIVHSGAMIDDEAIKEALDRAKKYENEQHMLLTISE